MTVVGHHEVRRFHDDAAAADLPPRAVEWLMPARPGLSPPANEVESVDPARPLARAISDAFASYASFDPRPERQIVIIQAMADGDVRQFLTRDPHVSDDAADDITDHDDGFW